MDTVSVRQHCTIINSKGSRTCVIENAAREPEIDVATLLNNMGRSYSWCWAQDKLIWAVLNHGFTIKLFGCDKLVLISQWLYVGQKFASIMLYS